MLYLLWPFGSLYYYDKLSSGISQWKTTVVCFAYSAFHSSFSVTWEVPDFGIFGGQTQKKGVLFKAEANLVQNYASRGGKNRNLSFECKTD